VEIDSRKCVDLELLKTIFYRNWTLDTCHPLFCQDWSIHDPAIGQNDVTALVICSIFGGEIVVCHRYSLEYFWNILPCGQKMDLTNWPRQLRRTKERQSKRIKISEILSQDFDGRYSIYPRFLILYSNVLKFLDESSESDQIYMP
jgi:hypothetical protein